jgi:hypothetical protein
MSAPSTHKHHGITTAMIAGVGALVLYVLTWPIVELDYFRPAPKRPFAAFPYLAPSHVAPSLVPPTRVDPHTMEIELRPSFVYQPVFTTAPDRWTDTFYYPIHCFRLMNDDNWLQDYYSWWHDKWWQKQKEGY